MKGKRIPSPIVVMADLHIAKVMRDLAEELRKSAEHEDDLYAVQDLKRRADELEHFKFSWNKEE